MKTFLLTGGIGSGKSVAARYLEDRGFPVYDSDSRTKALYDSCPGLLDRLEAALGSGPLRTEDGSLDRSRLASLIFGDPALRIRLEEVVYPYVLEDFEAWKGENADSELLFLESAVAASCPVFDGAYDGILEITADEKVRMERVLARDPFSTPASVLSRIRAQRPVRGADFVIENNGGLVPLYDKIDKFIEMTL